MPFTAILFALVQLGAKPSTLEGLGLIAEHTQKNHITRETLLKALKRLLAIVKAAALSVESMPGLNNITHGIGIYPSAAAFAPDDVPNVVLSLVILGLDPLTLAELHTQLNITMDVVCNYGATDYLVRETPFPLVVTHQR